MLAAFMLALSGCGGGSSTTAPPAPVDPTPPEPTPVAVDLSDVADDAMRVAGTATIAVAGGTATIGEVTFTCDAACTVVVDDMGNATSTGGMATAATSSGYATRKANEAAAVAATTKEAGTKADAIKAEAAQTATGGSGDDGLGGEGIPSGTSGNADYQGEYVLSVKRDRMGTTVKIDTPGGADGTTAVTPEFMAPQDLGGGNTMHVRTMEADDDGDVVEEVVIVSTDIEAPAAVAFAKFKNMLGVAIQTLNARTDNTAPDATNAPANSLAIAAGGTTATSVDLSKVKSTSFVGGSGAVVRFDGNNTTTVDTNEASMVDGTYNGARGMYACADQVAGDGYKNACTVTLGDKGVVASTTGTWVFKPAPNAMSDQPDYDYVSYGFWLKKTTDDMDEVTYNEVETFATASRPAMTTIATSVIGRASYKGGATGVYVKNVFKTDGTIDMATAGHFTAEANLMATFGQVGEDPDQPVADGTNPGTIPPNMLNTLTGTINKFMLSGGEEQMWSVDLDGDIDTATATASGTAKGGVKDENGSFSANFHRALTNTDAAAGTLVAESDHPTAVVGEFNSVFSDGSVAGAFGTQLQKEE